ncbi:hypothetical protein KDA_77050 [Dictyobacter alpinus]|uniref:Uncharacterized protein n=1 Tax=Dictyobacter alpinus TaxID=2014873 RepID=A0A402BLJ5_9CHLR|nr:hypothetical protein [Dictyobacter alpinus]GCE32221.1 hypothetical protein KDA_77050 [Dictyobacter alpinus]
MTSTYLDYEVEIEDYHPVSKPAPSTRPGSSARRYSQTTSQQRPASQTVDTTTSRIRRASATRARTTDEPQPAVAMVRRPLDETEPQARIKRQATRPHYPQPQPQSVTDREPKPRRRWIILAGAGMCTALLIYLVMIQVYAWWMNTITDPITYSQAAHRDVVTVLDAKGHPEQIRVFVDGDGHVCELISPITPERHSVARIVVGPNPTQFTTKQAQEVALTVSAHDGSVTIEAVGKVHADILPHQTHETWTTDVDGKPVQPQLKEGK